MALIIRIFLLNPTHHGFFGGLLWWNPLGHRRPTAFINFWKFFGSPFLLGRPVYQFWQKIFSDVNQKSPYFPKLFLLIFDFFEKDFQTFNSLELKISLHANKKVSKVSKTFVPFLYSDPPVYCVLQRFRTTPFIQPPPPLE